ncbi:Alcohol dehydrogenase 2 [Cladophialophora carrionii]|uniref:Alcohol dehydrogenase 2 n=1 Tax=Cladophialophora carrionii TaxID=86049 RepID=A0A1C1C8R2_9EURO|nr:Alcohol dehydrogenase 2 [Cladophialophora carrionii]
MASAPNLPAEYKVGVFEAKGEPIKFKQVKLELPKPGEVLVKVLACGVCHSDHAVRFGLLGNSFPIVPGHEVIGEVAAIPDTEKKWKVDDRVGGPWHGGHDQTCVPCQRGLFQMCENEAINGVTKDGGYGEYVTLRTEAVVRIPSDADPAEYCPLLCAGVTVFNSLRQQKVLAGSTVAVQGLGGLGHLALQYASKAGYRTVAISSSADKKDFATQLGAHDYIDASKGDVGEQLQKLGGASCILFTAPNEKLIPSLLNGLGPLGKLIVLAAAGPVEVNTASMIGKGLSIQAWPSGHALDSEEAISFAQVHGVHCMIEKFPLDKANEAMEKMTSGKVRFRGVLIP